MRPGPRPKTEGCQTLRFGPRGKVLVDRLQFFVHLAGDFAPGQAPADNLRNTKSKRSLSGKRPVTTSHRVVLSRFCYRTPTVGFMIRVSDQTLIGLLCSSANSTLPIPLPSSECIPGRARFDPFGWISDPWEHSCEHCAEAQHRCVAMSRDAAYKKRSVTNTQQGHIGQPHCGDPHRHKEQNVSGRPEMRPGASILPPPGRARPAQRRCDSLPAFPPAPGQARCGRAGMPKAMPLR